MKNKPELVGYFEEYKCGCVSETVKNRKDLLGYCGKHGEDKRKIYPVYDRNKTLNKSK
jgi:hypothetical protein